MEYWLWCILIGGMPRCVTGFIVRAQRNEIIRDIVIGSVGALIGVWFIGEIGGISSNGLVVMLLLAFVSSEIMTIFARFVIKTM